MESYISEGYKRADCSTDSLQERFLEPGEIFDNEPRMVDYEYTSPSESLSKNNALDDSMHDGNMDGELYLAENEYTVSADFFQRGNTADASEFDLLVQTYVKNINYASFKQTILNQIYIHINAGIIALPFAANAAGVPLFCLLLVAFSSTSSFCTSLLLKMALEKNVRTLEDLGEVAFGAKGFVALCILQICYSVFLISCSFFVIGTSIPQVLYRWTGLDFNSILFGGQEIDDDSGEDLGFRSRVPIILICAILIFPLCFLRSMAAVSWLSRLSVVAMGGGIMATAVSLGMEGITTLPTNFWSPNRECVATVFLVALCFSYQQRAFHTFNVMRKPIRKPDKWIGASKISNAIVCILFACFGIAGYWNRAEFMGDQDLNYFSSYEPSLGDSTNNLIDVIAVVVALALLFTVPGDSLMAVTCCRRLIRRVQSTSDEPEPSAPTLLNDEYDSYPGENQSVMTGESALNDSYNILNLTTHEKPCCTTSNDVLDILAVLGVWITSLALCMLLRVESAVVAGLGVFILSTLCYLVPSMIYFRTGVSDDFKAIPLPIINVLPYRLLMMCVQIFALLFVATSFYVFIFFSFPGGKSIASFQYK